MTLGWVLGFVGMASLYAAVSSLVILAAAGILRRFPGWRVLPLLFTTLVFVFMTQHPFPVPGQLQCPVPSAAPQMQIFHFWATFAQLVDRGAAPADWLSNRTVAATGMNFLLCSVIGCALALHATRLRSAFVFGGALTLLVELTQLTGLWGVYPCAYRQFNVDDLILNLSGVVAGFLLGKVVRGRRLKRASH